MKILYNQAEQFHYGLMNHVISCMLEETDKLDDWATMPLPST